MVIIMAGRNVSLSVYQAEHGFAAVLRNLLLYGLLFHLFVYLTLFSDVNEYNVGVLSNAGNLYNQLSLPTVFLVACFLAYAYRVPAGVLVSAGLAITPFLLMALLSAAWSDYSELTIRRASHEIIELGILVVLATCFSNTKVLLAIFFRAFLIMIFLDLIAAAFFADAFTIGGFAGIHSDKNIAGQFFFVALPVCLLGTFDKEISGSRLLGLVALVSCAVMLILTESKTSIGATPVALLSVLLIRGLYHHKSVVRLVVLICCVVGLLFAVVAFLTWDTDAILEVLVRDPTLTGRDMIWRFASSKFDGSPLIGVGYGAIWQVGPQIEAALKEAGLYFVFNEAHNGYLEIAAQLGIAGIICLSIFLAITLANAVSFWSTIERNTFCGAGALTLYMFFGLLIFNITESLYFQTGVGNFSTLIFLGAYLAGRKKALKRAHGRGFVPLAASPRAI
jgi:exopolysaccharide production protein ExoQ